MKSSTIKREQDCRSDSEHRVEDAVDDDDEEVENRRRRRRRIGARASGRVAAGIGSSLEIAVGWLPHRLGRFIRGFLGGRSGERATRRRLETCPEEDLIVGNREIVFPFHALRPIYNLRERVVVRERERKRESEEPRRDPGETNNVTLNTTTWHLIRERVPHPKERKNFHWKYPVLSLVERQFNEK